MKVSPRKLWATVSPHGDIYCLEPYRRDAQECEGEFWAKQTETPQQGWRRAYRKGYRCIRVAVVPASAISAGGDDAP